MEQRVVCSDCQTEYDADVSTSEEKRCPKCGSIAKTITVQFEDRIEFHDQLAMKSKRDGEKPHLKAKVGDNYDHSRGKYVHIEQTVDRDNNRYRKLVKDKETGEIIRDVDEPLSDHKGYGSAKGSIKK